MALTFRQKLLAILAVVCGKSQKEIAAAARMSASDVSHYLSRGRQGDIKGETFDRLLAAMDCRPAVVWLASAFVEAWEALERRHPDLTPEEQARIEEAVFAGMHLLRAAFLEAVQLSRAVPSPEAYPEAHDLVPARLRAEELFVRLERHPHEMRLVLVEDAEEFQTWYLCERVCLASVEAASRDLGATADWAQLAQEIAALVRVAEEFRIRLRGYALAHAANVLRVSGKLKQADATFEEAKRLWHAGEDPAAVLDPGRLPDLEGSLRRAQRRFGEALVALDKAAVVGRSPERALINKGFTLEVMGEYERAVQTLLQVDPERLGDARLFYMQRFNLAVCFTHVGRYSEAGELVEEVSDLVGQRGDEIEAGRVTWLRGRIAAGLGRRTEALKLLEVARREFESRQMSYDVALALLEEAVLLLEDGRAAEVKALAEELTQVFAVKGVHREALAALRLFAEAVKREDATAELARRVLRFLFRARHDRGLRFES